MKNLIVIIAVALMLALVAPISAQKLLIGGTGIVSPTGAALFVGGIGERIAVTTTWFGGDIFSADLILLKPQLMLSWGGRVGATRRDKTADFVSALFIPELVKSGDWVLTGVVGPSISVGPGTTDPKTKIIPIFGVTLLKAF